MNAFGLEHLLATADPVQKGVALILVIMSMASWYVIVMKTLALLRLRRSAQVARREYWQANSLQAGVEQFVPAQDNPFAQLARTAAELQHATRAGAAGAADPDVNQDRIARHLRASIEDSADSQQAGLSVLASVSSTAPFVGLFGTGWGIYHALISIGAAGQASLDKVAGPVGEALIMTALGLAVAIPAALGYNAIVRAHRRLVTRLKRFGHDLQTWLATGQRPLEPASQPSGQATTASRAAGA
jgi:biopolymer transport protein ExbB